MTNTPGHLQERPLIDECAAEAYSGQPGPMIDRWGLGLVSKEEKAAWRRSAILAIAVLRRRGLINEQGLEIIKREME